ncbi:hypothetical protein FACS18942_00350 [Planctomycetales bacterium]|nr:hypothetical protein FACS18942_00350 [Planctomycetales bacterium]
MLHNRLIFGTLIIAAILSLFAIDLCVSQYGSLREIVWLPRGIVLIPFYLVCLFFLTGEVLQILAAAGLHPRHSTVYCGNLLIAASCWFANVYQHYKLEILGETISRHGWEWSSTASFFTLLGVAAGIIICFYGEMRRYSHPGGVTVNLAGAVFAITYLGLLSCYMIQLRMAYGIAAVLSLVVTAKMCDIGAYTVGHLIGRHKMTPVLSPGKTIEGALGGILFCCAGTYFWFCIVLPIYNTLFLEGTPFSKTPPLGWLLFGISVAVAGMIGDLAGSLIKRDSQMKDSGNLLPGFGGILDVFDSLLMTAPVVYFFWACGIVCPGYHR